MDIAAFDYAKPELLDFNVGSAMGKGGSCYVDCSADEICPGSIDEIPS